MEAAVQHLDGAAAVVLAGDLGPGTRDVLWPLLHRYEGDQITIECGEVAAVDPEAARHLVTFARALDGGQPVLRRPPAALVDALRAAGGLGRFVIDPG